MKVIKAKNGRKGAMYAEPVEWVSPAGEKLFGNVVINAEFTWEQFGGKLLQRNLINFKEPLGFSKIVFIKTTYFEENLVNFFVLKIKVSNHFKRSNTLLRRTLQKYLVTTRTRLSAKKFYTKTNMRLLL